MDQYTNHEERTVNSIIPYLFEFPNLIKYLKDTTAYRYQTIEDILWDIWSQLDLDNATGVWLDYLALKVGWEEEEGDINEWFTFGPTGYGYGFTEGIFYTNREPWFQYLPSPQPFQFGPPGAGYGFGLGKFNAQNDPSFDYDGQGYGYNQGAYYTGDLTDYYGETISNDDIRREFIRTQIAINHSSGTHDEVSYIAQRLTDADSVLITDIYPAAVNLTLSGANLRFNRDTTWNNIESCLPAGVSLNHVYYDNYSFIYGATTDGYGYGLSGGSYMTSIFTAST